MWCKTCQQDVPGIASVENDGGFACARCGDSISVIAQGSLPSEMRPVDDANIDETDIDEVDDIPQSCVPPPPLDLNDWELEEDLSAAERLLQSINAGAAGSGGTKIEAIDPAHAAIADWHAHLNRPPTLPYAAAAPASAAPVKPRASIISWLVLSLGLMAFVCGGVLLGWSFIGGRGDLWSIGMPLTLAGLAGLVVGLVFQMDGLTQTSRETTDTLDELNEQIHDLKHATTMMSTTHSSAAQSFYAHMADGANPQLLLADLKGQLDLLAVKMAKERR